MTDISQAELVRGLIRRDEKALETVIEEYGPLIRSIVRYHMYRLESMQDECVNDILLAIWQNGAKFDPAKNTLKNWIGAISKYKCIDYKRKYLQRAAMEEIDENMEDPSSVDQELMRKETERELEEMLSCLKPKDRELFYKRYIQNEDIKDISKSCHMGVSAIYNRLSRGRKLLRLNFQKR